jgi:hypothetical protein
MKKMSAAIIAMTLVVSMFGSANAGTMNGMGGGCENCPQQGGAPSDPFRKFQADTIDLRQEMMTKRFETQRENLKAAPDAAKLAALKADIKLLQTKILAIRDQSGLPVDKSDGECGQKMGKHEMKGMGDCGKGRGGCNNGPCGQK